jgi:hypothetical protein
MHEFVPWVFFVVADYKQLKKIRLYRLGVHLSRMVMSSSLMYTGAHVNVAP